MSKSFKFISVIIALLMIAVLFSGCTKSNSTSASSDTIKVGALFELTGGVATFGTSSYNGAKLYIDEINKNGGVLGKKIVLLKADNKSQTDESINQATKLIQQDKVIAILGPVTSTDVKAASSVAMQNHIPLITGSATAVDVTVDPITKKVKNEIFRACFIDPYQGSVMAQFASEKLNAKTAVVYIDDKSDYSKGLAQSFKEQFEKLGGKVIDTEAYVAGDQDFKAALTKIKGLNPDVIFVPGYYQETGKITKQARDMGITATFLGGDGWDSPDLVKIAGESALNNVYFSNHFINTDPDKTVQDFKKKYTETYGVEPDAMAALAYDSAGMLVQTIKDANSTEPAKIIEALSKLKNFKGVTGTITINSDHNPVKSAVIIELKDGKQNFVEKVASQ
ncbi:ABC transporter substrate-binding protein [Thermoanaerobacterium thermosaccharolyticum]|mgnify:CR=1 FL=1|uniref:Amino acid/amide ABC transporter substrate-binding protein, HAAT family n=1 Tax=Thermoanaerobacterium thermosaccharolyticum M0795 TaxID=698948 RepID=L0INA9_THETR|nr:ABC transporter substrate-binding protein [Thermoanaerobacterium thermosaccharolyticum]AGB19457.1 amino acid/amide ABC transporter substrate-binding protein, HAAT family [Thermoanaerobacterium thermosaccharolyticum M0795]MBE0068910.1 ABC transporter substrate-binding protein [Thermoanaerobacterium thermosaccharolyticum]MBE0227083.1 ABC transporter substrate-binding protein [Thermoanaerobacterium thermosaccharolyticum]MCP2238959.1 branched-chain amino acid transport system substrate-binding p